MSQFLHVKANFVTEYGERGFVNDKEGLVFIQGRGRYLRERMCKNDGVGMFRCTSCGAFAKHGLVMDTCNSVPIRYCPNCGAKVVSE